VSGAQWFSLAGFTVLVIASLYLARQVASGIRTKDKAAGRGSPGPAVAYSLTAAMLPWKKESARLHLPAYTMGILYHVGGFLSFLWLAIIFFDLYAGLPRVVRTASAGLLVLAVLCGLALLIRRIADPKLRHFSTPDDYFSNLLVTGFQALTAAALIYERIVPGLYIYAGVLMMYIPLGKLRHAVYFVFARTYLGIFYGRRGVWPPRNRQSWQQ
jgi:hypothetical protein